jgi:hypothetical protein
VLYEIGYQIEIGDVVAVDYDALKLSNFEAGARGGGIKLFQVLNKILDNKTGDVSLDLVNTIFDRSDRFGLISPSTLTGVGSTTSKLIIKKSYGTLVFQKESFKWTNYIDQNVIVHNEDFSLVYPTVLRGFDDNDPQGMSIDPIPTAPGENWTIESVNYPSSTDPMEEVFWKTKHAYFSPQVSVTVNGTSEVEFEVDASDIAKFLVGASVKIHNYDYTDDAPEAEVIGVDNILNLVTIDIETGFNITTDHTVDLIGFADGGPAYRIV